MLPDRSRRRTSFRKTSWILCLLLLVAFGTVCTSVSRYRSLFSRNLQPLDLARFGAAASYDLTYCTPSSKAPICKWAKQYSRATRKRPADWKAKPGWPEDNANSRQHSRYVSERSLSALVSVDAASHNATARPLQEVLDSVWPLRDQQLTAKKDPSNMPQCSIFAGQACVTLIGNASILPIGVENCLVVRVVNSADTCPHSANVWITHQLPGSSLFLGMNDGSQGCGHLQMLSETKAVWYLGGQLEQVQQIHSSAITPSAVHFPTEVWRQRYISAMPVMAEATDKHPSPLWTGLMSILECIPGTTSLHVHVSKDAMPVCELCDASFEQNYLSNLTQASLITLHQCTGSSCETQTGPFIAVEQGIATAGVKLYHHKTKWQQSKGRAYADDEEEEEDANS